MLWAQSRANFIPQATQNTKAQWANAGSSPFGLPGKRRERKGPNGSGRSIEGHGSGQIGVSRLLPPRRGGVRGGDAVAVGFRTERHLLQPHHHLLQDLLPVSPTTQTPTASAYRSLFLLAFGLEIWGKVRNLRGPQRHGPPSVTKRVVKVPSSSQSSSCFAWRRLGLYRELDGFCRWLGAN